MILCPIFIEILTLYKSFIMKKNINMGLRISFIALSIILMACGNNTATTSATMDSTAATTATED